MTRLIALTLLLAACAPKPSAAPQTYRDTARQVYSIAAFDPARMEGQWAQVAGFGAACQGGNMTFGATVDYALCLPQGPQRGQGAMASQVPGRFDLPGVGPFWVLWADADNRTLVVGEPAGRYGLILNRGRALPADRLTAARDILSFNGYDLSQLVVY